MFKRYDDDMNRRTVVADSLAASVVRLDAVLKPWGFAFKSNGVHPSHTGPYAAGHYCRNGTQIGLSCRDAVDNIYYQHSFVTETTLSRETERFTIGHDTLMRALGHSNDCRLICCDDIPDAIAARDGGDRVAALIHDLKFFAASILCEPCEEFYAIVRRGYRNYSIV
jgi:hypothetical protein